jgi:hypothetical protein
LLPRLLLLLLLLLLQRRRRHLGRRQEVCLIQAALIGPLRCKPLQALRIRQC